MDIAMARRLVVSVEEEGAWVAVELYMEAKRTLRDALGGY